MKHTTYNIVGTSVRNGQRKLRFSNGDPHQRGRRMAATGNTEIALFRLPPITRHEAEAAFEHLIHQRATPAYQSADFDYEQALKTPRPQTDLVDRAVKFVMEMA
jgi:hypothetical protein